VFGNAGAGKSTLARKLAELTRLPLHVVDKLQFRAGGEPVPHEEYLKAHTELLKSEAWIIDGFGGLEQAWERFAAADTLIHVDLPLFTHFWWVTKRFVNGLFADPEGWPQGSPLLSSTLQSYRVLWPCHRHLTPKYRTLVAEARQEKKVYQLRSAAEIEAFLKGLAR
jgi:adenylate kinase family enzyme